MNLLQSNNVGDVSLESIEVMAQAQDGEVVFGPFCAEINERACIVDEGPNYLIIRHGVRQYLN